MSSRGDRHTREHDKMKNTKGQTLGELRMRDNAKKLRQCPRGRAYELMDWAISGLPLVARGESDTG